MDIRTLLIIIAVLVLMIWWEVSRIAARLKDRSPTEKEQDYKWALRDPMGHWEAHKDDKKTKAGK
jgi:hypothetical protein